ncbi:BREX-1 system adenine-specific DNA-methyltransferase PglX [Paenibacillus sp. WQ 127069]|uniref:site-specific DNA-methyltransferase (adenine-specific) n=1 Tax=Paenibacillus baimaensis TaxID=2982185 RepID=A0ABT2UQA0_9BACL|nr:BREX-1 system adenine-specific DNA-methyltransferase PglX [Paenibacillus sp. WQ 127069]MCU6796830.1 BREX-1 system adenine-specific DNA-methyltransferase PglX [Paenibacillus sp. WQ 127069]
MNKTAIKNFAVWARNKLIAEIIYKAGLLGITDKGIKNPLPQSTKDVQFYDIGTKEPYSITGVEIEQRRNLTEVMQKKEKQSDYKTAFKNVIEEVAYTWFNRLIAVRFMEVNDYLPFRIRVLSSESSTKTEPDLVTSPFDAELDYAPYERDRIIQLKNDNKLDELFRMLFIKQCNALNVILPGLFEKTNDYTELLMNVSFTDKDGVVYRLVHGIPEDDFNVEKEGQVEIIGWLYQYYNDERKDQVINIYKGIVKKEDIPAATQLFTTDWVVRYMIDNSLGKYWLERNPGSTLKNNLEYLVDDAIVHVEEKLSPEDLKVLDPCMGSGHILVYAFEVLMAIYQECGYSQREAAVKIVEKNLYGLDIDNRAYQLAYFAVMMKSRQYNRRILNGGIHCNVYAIQESNGINHTQLKYFGFGMGEMERNKAQNQIEYLLDTVRDAREYGSILQVDNLNWEMLHQFIDHVDFKGQMTLDTIGMEDTQKQLSQLVKIAVLMSQKYDVVATNPPYLNKMDAKLKDFVNKNFKDYSGDLFSVFIYRSFAFCKQDGYSAFMSPFVWMFIKTYEKLREYILTQKSISSLIQMEYSAFEEATVPICTFILKNGRDNQTGTYIKLSDFKGGMYIQRQKVLQAIADNNCGYYYQSHSKNISKIPGMPIAYWLSEHGVLNYLRSKLLSEVAETKQGFKTGSNDKFLRLWFEVSYQLLYLSDSNRETKKWFPCNKGGAYRKWYGNLDYVVNWENEGFEIRNYKDGEGNLLSRPQNLQYNFREALTWSSISSGPISLRYSSPYMMFESKGSGCFVRNSSDLYTLHGFLNSKVGMYYISALAPTLDYSEGSLLKLPYITCENEKINLIVKKCIELSNMDWDSFETSWDFICHPFLAFCSVNDENILCNHYRDTEGHKINLGITKSKDSIENAFMKWSSFSESQFNQLKSNEEELNRIFIDIYGLQDELISEVEDKDVTIRKANLGRDVRSFLSYAVGCMFGRYSLDVDGLVYAGGEWDDSKYANFIPDKDNVISITDEQYFEDDIVGLFSAFLKNSFGSETLEENLDFIAKALGDKGNTSREVIRNYFLKDFFKDHCKIYQKRPIYWLFDSGKADGFKALIYMHRYNEDTIGNLRIDYLHRMQRVYDSEIARMHETINNSNNAREVAAATKRKEKLTKQLKETKEYDEKIAHLALARISIDLDDGVKVNYDKVQTGTDGKKLDVLVKI